jgi:hypothetical protein
VGLHVSGLADGQVEVEVVSLLADRVVGRSMWTVAVAGGSGELEITVPVPETRTRVLLGLVAKAPVDGEMLNAAAESMIVPHWAPTRMKDVADDPQVAIVDPERLIAPALGDLQVEKLSPYDRTSVSRYRGELIICHGPEYGLAARRLPEALVDQLTEGTSVLWLTPPRAGEIPFLHSGRLTEVAWPFRARPGSEIAGVREEDLRQWAGGPEALPLPYEAVFEDARLVVCSDRLLKPLEREPAAGWLWEAVVARALKPVDEREPVRRLRLDGGGDPVAWAVAREPVVAVLDIGGDEWAYPDDEHAAWLEKVGRLVADGGALVVVGAGPARSTALRHLDLSPLEFVRSPGGTDLLLAPNLPLWGIGESDAHEALLTRRGDGAIAEYEIRQEGARRLLATLPHGKGVVLLCQIDFDESRVGARGKLLAHLARQLERELPDGTVDSESGG